jgi:Mrp family chromosome partitioning ATPase
MRAQFWLRVGIGVVIGAGVGAAVLARTDPVYASSTSVLVEAVGAEVNMQTEAELVRSTQVMTNAHALLADTAIKRSDDDLVEVAPVPGTSVLVIRFEARTAEVARAGAAAYAEAYLAARSEAARASIESQVAALQLRLDEVRNQLGEVNAQLARLPSNAPEIPTLRSTQTTLTTQANTFTTRINELRTTAISPGRVVGEAQTPTTPVRPNPALYLGLAAVVGASVGAGAQLIRTRWSRRVQQGGDLGRHSGIPLLADLDADAMANGSGPQHPSGRAFNRLRNEVVAALSPSDHTIIVTGAAPGPASMLVAANLAAAFARADSDVVLVGASVPDLDSAQPGTTLAALFDLADIPGLTDVLTGRTSLSRALQRAARSPRLRVVTPGGTASATGLLQSEGARGVLGALATKTRYVIVDAPSTASGADAQSLASMADVALLVVEAGRAQHVQVADAATQLSRVGTRLLGAVVVPRLSPDELPMPRGNYRSAAVPDRAPTYDTEGWIATRPDAFDVPTTKLNTVSGPAAPPPHDAESAAPTSG